jgi:hypothetical protein
LACFEGEIALAAGVECPQRHFLCDACFRGDHLTSQLSAESRGDFKRHGARLVCQWCLPGPPVHVFEDSEVASHLGREGFAAYMKAREEVAAAAAAAEAEERVRAEVASAAAAGLTLTQQRVAGHRRHIAEHILTLKCPRATCRQAILDFHGCLAMACPSCDCRFCGWCLVDCGHDAHDHVRECPVVLIHVPHRRGCHDGTLDEFNAVHREGRRELVTHYVNHQVAVDDRGAVRQAIAQDLRDIGVVL